ncbi:MAG: phosphoenolpyruvate--protein phosphotransferase [Lachnospiraceae bacterium]|nr:phosphoenolpyruvate--protein phosphotransferase [Lachnospiraceae bacterium]
MRSYQGKGIGKGIAEGVVWVYTSKAAQVTRLSIGDAEAEVQRFQGAMELAGKQLQALYEQAREKVGEEEALIFEVHQMMLEDAKFIDSIECMIREEQVNAEYAVETTGVYFSNVFASMEDAYIRERAADMRDVTNRVIGILHGEEHSLGEDVWRREKGVIVVAEDLLPSQTIQLDRSKICGFVIQKGTETCHTAILAKTMGIPAVVGADFTIEEMADMNGKAGAVDGESGKFYVEPEREVLNKLQNRMEVVRREADFYEQFRGKETVTFDGRRIELCANVGSLADLEHALEQTAEGIGLFRSEFLYLEGDDFPTEEEQFAIYSQAVERMGDKPVIIRTLDIGADKQSPYMELAEEKNPTMGCRGIRVCLKRPEIFKTQLRALFRAAVTGNLRVMYPMITSMDELGQIKAIVREVKAELAAEGVMFREPSQGVMIETPAAALISDELAKEVDFFSIGTNDLTQYTLACDRENSALDGFYDAHHPAVLKLIAMTVENAHKAGIPVGICGELAGDESLLQEWIQLGVDELSVAPGSILRLRGLIRKS